MAGDPLAWALADRACDFWICWFLLVPIISSPAAAIPTPWDSYNALRFLPKRTSPGLTTRTCAQVRPSLAPPLQYSCSLRFPSSLRASHLDLHLVLSILVLCCLYSLQLVSGLLARCGRSWSWLSSSSGLAERLFSP